ncbi:MAG: divalent-cation tolerance protein CutA [Candidatus Altiarchaeota archaeon]|nr:divalent-cation tolerance protein CutA [Candidatus Altiarchaeota archaeon]
MIVFAYITTGSEAEAKGISQVLVREKLAACTNYFPIRSVYKWQGEIQNDEEYAIIAKTVSTRFKQLKKKVLEIHSYGVPCVMALPTVNGNIDFIEWIEKETKK